MSFSTPKEGPIFALLSRAHSPTSANRIYTEKIQYRPLLIKPSEPTAETPSARQKRHLARVHKKTQQKRKLKPGPLTAKEKRASKIYDIPKSGQRYKIFQALKGMWEDYIREILFGEEGVTRRFSRAEPNDAGPKLVSADYHGAELEVVRSRSVSRVGVKGIVVRETRFTFEIITKNNEVKKVPKEGTVFRFELPVERNGETQDHVEREDGEGGDGDTAEPLDTESMKRKVEEESKPLIFEIHGSQFQHRASDRAIRKVKAHHSLEL